MRDAETSWQALAYNPVTLRAIEIALLGRHSLAVVGHPENGSHHLETLLGALSNGHGDAFSLTWVKPCACGYLGDYAHACECSPRLIERLRRRWPAADMWVESPSPSPGKVPRWEPLEVVRARVEDRIGTPPSILDEPAERLFRAARERLGLSLLASETIGRVASTIAQLDRAEKIKTQHVAEAVQYRRLSGKSI